MTVLTEGQIFTAVVATLSAGLVSRGVQGVAVKQWYQPRQQGAPTGMALLLSVVGSHRHGFLGRSDSWADSAETHTETQAMEITLQCTGFSPAPAAPLPLPPYKSGDLAKMGARILASDAAVRMLRANYGLGIERITDVREPYSKDERDQFIGSASFDFTMAFTDVEQTTEPAIDEYTLKMTRV